MTLARLVSQSDVLVHVIPTVINERTIYMEEHTRQFACAGAQAARARSSAGAQAARGGCAGERAKHSMVQELCPKLTI
eukprot:COSAG05_NODE_1175_length_5616_cov_2.565343_8_plen_78_part_00